MSKSIDRALPFVIALLPSLVGLLLFAARSRGGWADFMPLWNDEVVHWHQAATFSVAGFDGGYYTVNEMPARASFAHFYAWGPVLPMFYGAFMRVLGQSMLLFPLLNAALFTGALFVFIRIARLDRQQMIVLGVVAATFIPFQVFLPTLMQEALQSALAVFTAAGMIVVLRSARGSPARRRSVLLMVLYIVVIAQTRATWAFLLIPLFALWLPLRWALPLGGVGVIVVIGFSQWIAAPNASVLTQAVGLVRTDALAALRLVADHARNNLSNLVIGHPIEYLVRAHMLLLISYFGWRARKTEADAALFGGLVLITVFVIGAWYIGDWRDFRHLAPSLLLSLVLLIAWRRYRLIGVVLLTTMLILPFAVQWSFFWSGLHVNADKRASYAVWQTRLAEQIRYQPDVLSAWCNTVTMSLPYVESEIALALDAGMGMSILLGDMEPMSTTLRARYLLLHEDESVVRIERLNVEWLLDVPDGALYLNLDAAC
ncbi:MAG: hypothetical protein SGI73_11865 [Chloroflexota bacterium]|nr:hypothetical protein [Chloroflexota bacterium]